MQNLLILLFLSSCSWVNLEYWEVRTVIIKYQNNINNFEFDEAKKQLTKASQLKFKHNFDKKYAKNDLKNYKKLAQKSDYSIKSIKFVQEGAIVTLDEKIPDYELIFGYIVAWHLQQSLKNSNIPPLDAVIDNFIEKTISESDDFYLVEQETVYLLVKENSQWKVKLD